MIPKHSHAPGEIRPTPPPRQKNLSANVSAIGSVVLAAGTLVLAACSWPGFSGLDGPPLDYRQACGRQCLANAEQCTLSLSRRNRERQFELERARQNWVICMRQTDGSQCIPPPDFVAEPGHCGDTIDDCLAACDIGLDDVLITRR
jgi:hypothetical protein